MSNKITKATSKAVLVLMHHATVEAMDHCVKRLDLDRSKFVRAAIREKIQREGGTLKGAQ
jgi:metal-responsive CopG/Arc/MetJ family transcriptional regulator